MDHETEFRLTVNDALRQRRAAELLVREAASQFEAAERERTANRGHRFSIVRAVNAASSPRGLQDGIEREWGEEAARQAGRPFDQHRPWIPWSVMGRTLNVGTGSLGGHLVDNAVTAAAAALFPVSTVVRLGATVLDGLRGDINIPRVTGNGTGYWLGELGTATASDPTLGQIACSPKHVGAFTQVSRQLLLQSQAEALVGRHLMGLLGAAIDAAVIAGTSTDATVPLGIRYASGITLSTGTSYDNAAAQAQVKAAATANVVDENIKFLGTPAVRELLAKRAANGTGSEYLWSRDRLASKPAFVSGNVPASTILCGDFSHVVIPTWGPGLQVETDPFQVFAAGIVGMRVFASLDVAVTQPAAFAVSVSIT